MRVLNQAPGETPVIFGRLYVSAHRRTARRLEIIICDIKFRRARRPSES
jgi:hypothetical protein